MNVSGLTGTSGYGAYATHRGRQAEGSFQDFLSSASTAANANQGTGTANTAVSGTGSVDGASQTVSGNGTGQDGSTAGSGADAVKNFLNYMHETPGERMFDSFLGHMHISKAEYAAMSGEDKAKVMAQFKEYMKQKIAEKQGLPGSVQSAES
ncbi:MAG: hypothetical protein F8N37_03060 [Telmatospirillum sp.]|nr:hypothetical protein [Telmatospirillum sp.]